MQKQEAIKNIILEHDKAIMTFLSFNSRHEGIAVIREEYLELEREVFKKPVECSNRKQVKEASHLAAMAMRFLIDLCEEV